MTDFNNIFQNTAFPVAVCIVLFYALCTIIRNELKQNDNAMQQIKEANEKHLSYLQNQNEKLTNIISECTKALNDNTRAFNDLIVVINDFNKIVADFKPH